MKKHMTQYLFLVLTLLGVAGSSGVARAASTRYDYDRDVDFSRWQYLAWAVPVSPEASITERRLARAIEAGFSGRGYTLTTDAAKADFLVDFGATAWRDARVSTQWNGPRFGRSLQVDREVRGALRIVVIERRTGKVAWHGVVSDEVAGDPAKADQRTAKAVEKLLRKFPARGGAR